MQKVYIYADSADVKTKLMKFWVCVGGGGGVKKKKGAFVFMWVSHLLNSPVSD